MTAIRRSLPGLRLPRLARMLLTAAEGAAVSVAVFMLTTAIGSLLTGALL